MIKYILLFVSIFLLVSCGTKDNDGTVQNNQEAGEEQIDSNEQQEEVVDVAPESDPTLYQPVQRDESEYPESDPTLYQSVQRDESEYPESDPNKYQP